MNSGSKPQHASPSLQVSSAENLGVAHLESMIESHGVARQPPVPSTSDSIVGEVVDTHHPHRPGRVCVRWRDVDALVQEHWLAYAAHVRPEIGRYVVLARPSNWGEWIVTAMLSLTSRANHAESTPDSSPHLCDSRSVKLDENETIRVENAQGKFMFELRHTGEQPVLSLGRDLTISLDGTLRFSADRIEMRSGAQGTDLRSEGSTVLRAPQIRIN